MPARNPADSRPTGRLQVVGYVFAVLAGALMIAIRVVHLNSDAYAGLSWSSALLTDEGFYIHNARNVVLFGPMRMDGFNNALIMPTLHYLQVLVFSVCGVGAIQARMISVVLSLLTLCVLFAALQRAFNLKVAALGCLFLGLDHINALYNRMALMDTPAAFTMVCVFYVWVRSAERKVPEEEPDNAGVLRIGWLFLCGAVLALAYATRGLAAFLFPVPFLVVFLYKRPGNRWAVEWTWIGAGLALGLLIYGILWLGPHGAEIARLNRYYLHHQLIPETFRHLRENIQHAFFGNNRGFSPYLFRHSPVQFALALLGIGYGILTIAVPPGENVDTKPHSRAASGFLMLWLVFAWSAFAIINYSPSRYYVLFYPALAGLAALMLVEIETAMRVVWSSRIARATVGSLLAYHTAEIVFRDGRSGAGWVVSGISLMVAVTLAVGPVRAGFVFPGVLTKRRHATVGLLCMWALINVFWLGDWAMHLSYRQFELDRWLAGHLAIGTILIGDAAPGLCLDNHFEVVNVIPGLCNDDRPLEQFSSRPRTIAILDDEVKESWWIQHYPHEVASERRAGPRMRIVRWPVGIYPVR